jgi:SOS response regulatory protein OraA/RecX
MTDQAQNDERAEFARQLAQLYQQGGASAVRSALQQAGAPPELIDGLIEQLEAAASSAPAQSTMPDETIKMLVGNTVAVKTGVPEKLADWQRDLTQIRTDFAGRGADWAIEVAFADALLAVLQDCPATLPADNPYGKHLNEAQANIRAYHAGGGAGSAAEELTQEQQFERTMALLAEVYRTQGAEAVRAGLQQAGMDAETIEAVIAKLAADAAEAEEEEDDDDDAPAAELSDEEKLEQVMSALTEIYRQHGEAGVRAALEQSGMPAEMLEAVLGQVRQRAGAFAAPQAQPPAPAHQPPSAASAPDPQMQGYLQVYRERGEFGLVAHLAVAGVPPSKQQEIIAQVKAMG